jgi:hypothetical protein
VKLRKKIKLKLIKTLDNRIVLGVPKIDNFHNFIMSFSLQIGCPNKEVLEFDRDFNLVYSNYFFVRWNKHEIELFVYEDYVFIVLRFPKNEKEKIMKIIDDNFFFADEKLKDTVIKIEVDDK